MYRSPKWSVFQGFWTTSLSNTSNRTPKSGINTGPMPSYKSIKEKGPRNSKTSMGGPQSKTFRMVPSSGLSWLIVKSTIISRCFTKSEISETTDLDDRCSISGKGKMLSSALRPPRHGVCLGRTVQQLRAQWVSRGEPARIGPAHWALEVGQKPFAVKTTWHEVLRSAWLAEFIWSREGSNGEFIWTPKGSIKSGNFLTSCAHIRFQKLPCSVQWVGQVTPSSTLGATTRRVPHWYRG